MFRSSHQRCSVRECVLGNSSKFTGKHLCQRLFLIKLQAKRLWYRCFPVNFVQFPRTPFLQNTSERLLLNVGYKVKVFHEMTLKLYFMKCLERKISQCILPFSFFVLFFVFFDTIIDFIDCFKILPEVFYLVKFAHTECMVLW